MPTKACGAVVPQEKKPLIIGEIDLPDPGSNQLVIKQFASGICHSQLHQIHREREHPVILGHESTGIVLKAGSNVRHVKEGDSVMVTWLPRDAEAPPEFATLEVSGGLAIARNVFTWADHTLADEQYVIKISPDLKKDVTAIIGCAVITGAGAVAFTAKVQEGETVAIFGVGGVGLSAIAAAKEDPVEAIHKITVQKGKYTYSPQPVSGVDYAFDCIGIKQTMEQIVPACRTGQRTGS